MATTLKTIMKLDSGDWKKGLKSVNEALDAYAGNVKKSSNVARRELTKLYKAQNSVADKLSEKNKKIEKQKKKLAQAIKDGDKELEKSTRKKLKALAVEKSIISTRLQEAKKATAEQIRLNTQRINSENRVADAYDAQRKRFEDARKEEFEAHLKAIAENDRRDREANKNKEKLLQDEIDNRKAQLKGRAELLRKFNENLISNELEANKLLAKEEEKRLERSRQYDAKVSALRISSVVNRLNGEREAQLNVLKIRDSENKKVLSQSQELLKLREDIEKRAEENRTRILKEELKNRERIHSEAIAENDRRDREAQIARENSLREELNERERLAQVRERTEVNRARQREQLARQYENSSQERYAREFQRLQSLRAENIINNDEFILYNTRLDEARDRDRERIDRQTQGTENLANATIRYLRWAGTIAGVVYAIGRAYDFTLGKGMKVNSMMESQANGVAALISANTQMVDSNGKLLSGIEKFTIGQRYAKTAMAELRKEALNTPATFSELSSVYQQAIGKMLSLGNTFGETVDDISKNTIKFAMRITNISGSIGQEMDRAKEEIRSIANATVTTDSIIGTMLFGSPSDANQKIKEAQKTADGFKKLMDKMLEPFDVLANTRTHQKGILSLKDAWEKAMGDMVAKSGMFADITDAYYDMAESIRENTDGMIEGFDTFYNGVKAVGGVLDNILVPAAGVASIYYATTAYKALALSLDAVTLATIRSTAAAKLNPYVLAGTVIATGAYAMYEYFDDITDAYDYGTKILNEKESEITKLNVSELEKRQKILHNQLEIGIKNLRDLRADAKEYTIGDILAGENEGDDKKALKNQKERNKGLRDRRRLISKEIGDKKRILGLLGKANEKVEHRQELLTKLSINQDTLELAKKLAIKNDTTLETIEKNRLKINTELLSVKEKLGNRKLVKDKTTIKELKETIVKLEAGLDGLQKSEDKKKLSLKKLLLSYDSKESDYKENLKESGLDEINIVSAKIKLAKQYADLNNKDVVNRLSKDDIKEEIRLLNEKNKFVLNFMKDKEKANKDAFDLKIQHQATLDARATSKGKKVDKLYRLKIKEQTLLHEWKTRYTTAEMRKTQEAEELEQKIYEARTHIQIEQKRRQDKADTDTKKYLIEREELQQKINKITSDEIDKKKLLNLSEFAGLNTRKEILNLKLSSAMDDEDNASNREYILNLLLEQLALEKKIKIQKDLQLDAVKKAEAKAKKKKYINQIVDPIESGLKNALVSGIQDAINNDFDLTSFTQSLTSSIGGSLINAGVMNGNMGALGLGVGVTAVSAMIGDGGKTAEEIESASDKRIQEQTDKIINALDAQTSVFKSFGLESKVVKNEIEAERAKLISVAKDQASGSKTTRHKKFGGAYSSKTTSTINLSSLVNSISDIEKYYDTIKQKQKAGYKGMDIDALNIAIDEFASSSVDLVGTYKDLSITFKDIYTSLGDNKYKVEELADAKIDIGFTNINDFKSNLNGMIKYLDDYGTSVSELESDLTGEDYEAKLEALNILYKATGVNFLDSSEDMGEAVNNALDSIDSYSIVGTKLAEIASEKKNLDDEYLRIGKSELELRELDIKLLDESNQALQIRNWALEDKTKLNATISDLDFDLLFAGLSDGLKTTAKRAKVLAGIKDKESKRLQQEIYDKEDALKVAQDLKEAEEELNKINFDLGKEKLDLIYEIKKVGMNDAQKLEFDRKVELSQIYDKTSKKIKQEIYDKEDALKVAQDLKEAEEESIKNKSIYLDSFKTEKELLDSMFLSFNKENKINIESAIDYDTLDELFTTLSTDTDGLTDSDLKLLEANKKLIDNNGTLSDVIGNTTKQIEEYKKSLDEKEQTLKDELEITRVTDDLTKTKILRDRELALLTDSGNIATQKRIHLLKDELAHQDKISSAKDLIISDIENQINAEFELMSKFEDATDSMSDFIDDLSKIPMEFGNIGKSLSSIFMEVGSVKDLDTATDAKSNITDFYSEAQDAISTNFDNLRDASSETFDAEKERLEIITDAEKERLEIITDAEKESLSARIGTLNAEKDVLDSFKDFASDIRLQSLENSLNADELRNKMNETFNIKDSSQSLEYAQSYLTSYEKTAINSADLAFQKALVANKYESFEGTGDVATLDDLEAQLENLSNITYDNTDAIEELNKDEQDALDKLNRDEQDALDKLNRDTLKAMELLRATTEELSPAIDVTINDLQQTTIDYLGEESPIIGWLKTLDGSVNNISFGDYTSDSDKTEAYTVLSDSIRAEDYFKRNSDVERAFYDGEHTTWGTTQEEFAKYHYENYGINEERVPFADGGIVTKPTRALIGEAGYAEAVIPLKNPNDPLNMKELINEIRDLKQEVVYLKNLQVKQTANSTKQLTTQRAIEANTYQNQAS